MKRAVVFYSLTGNTQEAAEFVAKELSADLIQIDLVKPLPKSMGKQMLIGGMQATFGMCPPIKGLLDDISSYDEIILGTPIWAGKPASPTNTLIKEYGIADKITTVFTYSGGGDNDKCIAALGKTLKNLKRNVALADRNNELAKDNETKLRALVETIVYARQ